MNPNFAPATHFSREVHIDRGVLLAQLPAAIPYRVFTLRGDLIRIPEKNGAVWIGMTNLGLRHLGLDLPMMRLDFAFDGLSEREIHDFMSCYDLWLRNRGSKLPSDGTGGLVPWHGECRDGSPDNV